MTEAIEWEYHMMAINSTDYKWALFSLNFEYKPVQKEKKRKPGPNFTESLVRLSCVVVECTLALTLFARVSCGFNLPRRHAEGF